MVHGNSLSQQRNQQPGIAAFLVHSVNADGDSTKDQYMCQLADHIIDKATIELIIKAYKDVFKGPERTIEPIQHVAAMDAEEA